MAPTARTAPQLRPAARRTHGVSFEPAIPSHWRLHAQRLCRRADTLPRPLRNRNAILLALGADGVAALTGQQDFVDTLGAGEAGDRNSEPLGLAQELVAVTERAGI